MQPIVPVGDRNPNSHTEDEILDALRGVEGTRRFSFRYEHLDSTNTKIGHDLTPDHIVSGSVEQNWLADIKRKAKFKIHDDGHINFLSDRIKPFIKLHIPPYGTNDYVEWPQGVFLLSSPSRTGENSTTIYRDVEAYDALQVFNDDLINSRYTVAASASYTSTISTLLGSIPKSIQASTSVLPAAKEWDPGTSKLKIINELLNALNYQSLSFDEDGIAIVKGYTSPSQRAPEYVYADDEVGLINPNVTQDFDLFSIPNNWVLVVSDPDRAALVGTYTNTDPSSPTSTVRRGRTITDFRTEQDAADQTALNAKAQRLAFEASQIYEAVEFKTAMMPIHSGNDVYKITFSQLAIDDKYSEHSWSLDLTAGALMAHRARRVVTV